MESNTATEALENIGRMTEEMEERYEKQIDLLKFQVDDACAMAERYLLENRKLKEQLEVETISEKELELENEDLIQQVGGLMIEAREARRSFTAFQLAVSLLVFVYGMMYGAYFGKCR